MNDNYQVDDMVILKKKHPCKNSTNIFKILGYDGEVRLKCSSCGGIILLKKNAFLKAVKSKLNS